MSTIERTYFGDGAERSTISTALEDVEAESSSSTFRFLEIGSWRSIFKSCSFSLRDPKLEIVTIWRISRITESLKKPFSAPENENFRKRLSSSLSLREHETEVRREKHK